MLIDPAPSGALAEWERFRAATLHRRLLVERGEDPAVILAQDHVVATRYAEFRAAFEGKSARTDRGVSEGGATVLPFPDREEAFDLRESERFKALHVDRLPLERLPASLGTPDEWLGTAISHLKVQSTNGGATVSVSAAALDLLMLRWEHVEHGGAAWEGNAA